MEHSEDKNTVTNNQSVIRLEEVSKRYGATGTLALDGVNLGVNKGEFLTLVGPSGCGKSTILRLITGLGESSSGLVEVFGQTPDEARKSAGGNLDMVFQEPTLMPWRRVIRNVELPLELRGVSKKDRRKEAERVLETVNLQGARRQYPRQLSGGMKMRVSIARALASNPEVMLMDEPFGALDEFTRQKLQQDLLDIWQRMGVTIVFVTHNMYEAIFLSQRVAIMSTEPGQIYQIQEIPTPYPRDEDFRSSEEFSHLVTETAGILKEAR